MKEIYKKEKINIYKEIEIRQGIQNEGEGGQTERQTYREKER